MANNDHLVLIAGKSATGKSAALRNLKDPSGVLYLNCENNKKLPFKSGFREFNVTDPKEIFNLIPQAESSGKVHTVVVDTLTYLMDMYESKYVLTSSNTMKAWGEYAQFFKKLMTDYVAKSKLRFIFLAHTSDVSNEEQLTVETMVKVKGSLMNQGIESYFSTVVATKKVLLKDVKKFNEGNDFMNITEDDEIQGFKNCFQTLLTKDTKDERIRAPMGMWSRKETYVDNDAQHLLDRLDNYYAPDSE